MLKVFLELNYLIPISSTVDEIREHDHLLNWDDLHMILRQHRQQLPITSADGSTSWAGAPRVWVADDMASHRHFFFFLSVALLARPHGGHGVLSQCLWRLLLR